MKVTVFYTGTSLLAPLSDAEREINRRYKLGLCVAAYNFGSPLDQKVWNDVEQDLSDADIVFVIHVMDGENATRLLDNLRRHEKTTVVVINCMPELMRRTRMGKLDACRLLRGGAAARGPENAEKRRRGDGGQGGRGVRLFNSAGSWIGRQANGRKSTKSKAKQRGHGQYVKFIEKLPGILKFVPGAGMLRDIKNYLYLFCYFLQPTPGNIRSMLLYALKEYAAARQLSKIKIPPPERMPSVAIYHPDATELFESFSEYERWYRRRAKLISDSTIGLLLMRPQVVSKTTKHYDALIHAIEDEGLSVIPAISTLMDNREACRKFFLKPTTENKSKVQSPKSKNAKFKVQSSKFNVLTTEN